MYIVSSCFDIAWFWLAIVWLLRLNLRLVFRAKKNDTRPIVTAF
jgi:hypothetical protein